MMTSRMGGPGCVGLPRGVVAGLFLALALTTGAASGGDNAAFVSYSGVPSAMHPGDTATVTVTMRNTGTTTWKTTVVTETDGSTQTTTRTTYSLDAVGHGWGVNGVLVSGSVAPNATRSFQFTITAPETTTKRNYVFRWQMARDTVVTERPIHARSPGTFGAATPSRTIQVGPDMAPSFGNEMIPGQSWVKDSRITPVTLPGATGGNGTLSYALTCSLPPGVSFASATKRISGTPRRLWAETTCTWKVTDADDNTAASDADMLEFTIVVKPPDTAPSFGTETADDLEWVKDTAIASVVLPAATGGNGNLTYALSPSPPAEVTFNATTRTLSGTPTATQSPTTYTYTVTDSDSNTSASDADTLTFTIEVVEPPPPDVPPEFNGPVSNMTLTRGEPMSEVLTDASEGNGALHYSLSTPPRGLTFNSSTRRLSGTPTRTKSALTYTYTVTDSDDNTASSDADTLTFTIEVVEPPPPDVPPEFNGPVSNMTLTRGEPMSEVLTGASEGNGALHYSLSTPPRGLTFNSSTRRLAGTPTRTQSALPYTYTVTDSDDNTASSDADTLTFTIEVVEPPPPDEPPEFNGPVSNMTLTRGEPMSEVLTDASEGNGALHYSLSTPPRGLTFNSSTRRLAGTPTRTQSALTYTYTVTDSDSNTSASDSDTETFTIEVVEPPPPDEPPEFNGPVSNMTLTRGEPMSEVLTDASEGNGALHYSLSTPPRGLTFNSSTRRLAGTPTRTQSALTYTYTVTDSDSNTSASDSDTETFTIEVVEPPPPDEPPEFNGPVSNMTLTRGEPMSEVLTDASEGNGALHYSLSTPPRGLTFNSSTRTLSGTPTATQSATEYTYTVADSDGNTASSDADALTFTIEVVEPPPPDVPPELIGTVSGMTLTRGEPMSEELTAASGGNGELTYALSPSPPTGVTFNATTRTLSGTPTRTQPPTTYTYTVTDSDGNTSASDADTLTFTIEVVEPVLVLSETSLTVDEGTTDMTLEVKLAARPTGDVTVSLSSADLGVATVSPASLDFGTADYSRAQRVEVTGVQDDLDFDDESTNISLSASGGGYSGVSASVPVTVIDDDDDTAPSFDNETIPNQEWLRDSQIAPVTLPEATGGNGDLTYSLAEDPPAGVTFNDSTRTLSGTPTETQDATEYTYTVTDADDNTAPGDADTLTFTIKVVEPVLVLSETSLTVDEGTTDMTLEVKLAARPTGDVTVSLSSADLGVATVSPASLDFGTADYSRAQRVEVTGVQDDLDFDDESTNIGLSATDGGYSGVSASVAVTVVDNDVDTAPSFGNEMVEPMTLIQNQAMTEVLPEATGGNRELTYALSPSPPAGVTFNDSTRTLSGTPTATQEATTYTYKVTDSDDNTADSDADTLRFDITVEADTSPALGKTGDETLVKGVAVDIDLQVTGGNAPVECSVTPTLPAGVALDGSACTLSGTPTAVQAGAAYTFTATDADGDTATLSFRITVEADRSPAFGKTGDETFAQDVAVAVDLQVTGGNAPVECSVTPTLPAGVALDGSACTLSGTPTAVQAETAYTFTATDADDDTATLSFRITVEADTSPAFGKTGDETFAQDVAVAVDLQVTGGNAPVECSVTPPLPAGVALDASACTLSGTPTAVQPGAAYTFTATDADGDTATLSFTITVEAAAGESPSFGASTIADQTWVKNTAIDALTLPAATGGNGDPAYTLAGDLPAGVTFDASTHTLSGTPTKKQDAVEYTYTATDTDGDAASLSFTIEVAGSGSDDASFVSYTNVPSTMTAGSMATVTVRMQNTGTTTWTSADGYALGSRRPLDNVTWGLNRVSLPADVAPNATVDLTFEITAPATVQGHKFSWRMVRGASGWFGRKTDLLEITVEAADSPSFGASPILGQTWVKDTAIDALTLPAATGGNGELVYTLAGTLPAGVTFDASTHTLSGTPTAVQDAVEYTYTATDADGDAASLSFTIQVERRSSGDAAFVSYADVPSTMAAGSSATVTVTMQNTGTTTWMASAGYALGSQRPQDNETWGLNRVSLPSDVAPNAPVDFTFTITAAETTGSPKFRWQMVRGTDGWFGDKTELREITVEADESPSFGASPILGQTWVKNTAIDALTLPAATGGNGELTYGLAGTLPTGVTFDASTHTLSGTPAKKQEATEYTYTATDADGDAASLSFTIRVARRSSDEASFVSYTGVPSKMAAGGTATVTVTMQNTGTTTWTSSAGYKLGSQRPQDNETWGLSRVSLASDVAPNATVDFTFAITAPATIRAHKFRWQMVRDTDGWFGDKTELREITVEDPSFGDAAIPDQTWERAVPIDALTLPEASGGGGVLTYALTPSLPAGVTFTESTRMLSGTPTAVQEAVEYTYTATDVDGDAATLSFEIRVAAAPVDDASFVSFSGLPSKMAVGGTAAVTVTMQNTGTTTWTSSAGYKLGSQNPSDNETWGLSRVSLPSDVAPNATAAFTFTITAPGTTGSLTFRWRMVRDPGAWFGAGTGSATITVEDPSFGDQTIAHQTWVQNTPIETLTLPAASGGDGGLTYAFTPSLPDGVSFDAATLTLSGTPTAVQVAVEYTYTATDADGDAATLSFEIGVAAAPADDAAFVSSSGVPSKMAAGGTATVTVTMTNTGTTTWRSSAGYGLGSQSPPDNDTWGLRRASLSGSVAPNETVAFTFTITAPETTGIHTFAWRMVRDPGAWFGSGTGNVTITVEDPSFGDATVADQTWAQNTAVGALTLPAASGGDGGLTYALTPSLPDGVTFASSTRTLSGTPTAVQEAVEYTYTATDADGDAATLSFSVSVTPASSSTSQSATALPPPAPTGVFDMFEYWLLPRGSAVKVRARLRDGRIAPVEGSSWVRSFWRGELWGRKVALLGDPGGERYDIFEEVENGLDYWGTFEGAAAGGEARPSASLDRPFRWMNRLMAVGDVVESPVTSRLLSNRRRTQESVLEATMRLEVVSHRASFTIPAADGPTFEDVLEVRFRPDVERAEAHDTFYLARGYGAVYSRRSAVAAPGGVVEWWAVEKALTLVVPAPPLVPWFDPFSPGWPKTAVLNGNLDDAVPGVEGGQVRSSEAPGWTADSGDAVIALPPSGLDAGPWVMLLRGSGGGGDNAPDAAITEEWIPVEGGTYQLSACMRRENARDNVFLDFDDGNGRDADFADAHLVATSTGTWECRAVTKCIPGSVGAVRIRAARDGANLGDAWFDRIELKRIAACEGRPGTSRSPDERR